MRDALNGFEQSDFARTAFGPEVVERYAHYRTEWEALERPVTDRKRQRYFERI